MTGPYLETAAIHVIDPDIECSQIVPLQQEIDLIHPVIFKMLVADRIEGAALDHERQIALLENPKSVGRQSGGDIGNECVRIRQIIEHRYTGDCLRFLASSHACESLRRKEVANRLDSRLVVLLKVGDRG